MAAPPVPTRQASLAGGEIDPGLYARTNLQRYSDSLRLLRNMIPLQEGPGTNRPGFLRMGDAKVITGKGRLIPFIFSQGTLSNNMLLEFTPGVIRFWKNGALVTSGGNPVEVVTTYTADEIPRLKWVQRGQIMTLYCLQKTPMNLAWVNDTTWTFTAWTLTRAINAPANLHLLEPAPAGDETVAAKQWQIVVTAVKAETKEESLPSNVVTQVMALSSNKPARYGWDAVAGAIEYNVYRGRNGKWGYIGSASHQAGPTQSFYDDGMYPVYAEVPPQARDPFPNANSQPQVAVYHDQRLVTANPWNGPGNIEASRIGETMNFDRGSPPKATDAVTLNVASLQYEEIRNLISYGRNLLVMTNAKEQIISGSEGVITQDDIVFDDQPTHWGSAWIDPLLIGESVVFVQDVGATVRELLPLAKDKGNDLTLVARHLFRGRSVVSWCYAHEPFRVIWIAFDDGLFVSCTYVRQLDLWAWARHDTGGDVIESLCSMPEGSETVVYASVLRGGGARRSIEKMASRLDQALGSGVFLDSAVTVNVNPATDTVSGLDHLQGRTVYAVADGVTYGPFVVGTANPAVPPGCIRLPVQANVITVGLQIVTQGHTLDMYSSQEEVRPRRKLIKKVFMEVKHSMPFRAGQRFTDALQLATRVDEEPWTAPFTGLAQINIDGDWDDAGAVVWEHTSPTPLTILSVIREVDFGGS